MELIRQNDRHRFAGFGHPPYSLHLGISLLFRDKSSVVNNFHTDVDLSQLHDSFRYGIRQENQYHGHAPLFLLGFYHIQLGSAACLLDFDALRN